MYARITTATLLALSLLGASGCASYRVSSNVEEGPAAALQTPITIIPAGQPVERAYEVLGPIWVSVKKLTLFHPDPTVEQANSALEAKARAIGADAVIDVTYTSGIGMTTWGYMDAEGTGVTFVVPAGVTPAGTP